MRPGERSVRTWRDGAPARELFELPDWMRIAESLTTARLIYFSGITLSLYSNNGLGRLFAVLEVARQQGAKVAFDGNFRPRGWKGDLRARARYSSKRSSASISRCRPSTTKPCCGAIPARKRRSRGCKPSVSARSWSRTAPTALSSQAPALRIRAGPGSRGAGRYDRGRRWLQRRLPRGTAFRQRSGAGCRRRASARRQRHPPPGSVGASQRRRNALNATTPGEAPPARHEARRGSLWRETWKNPASSGRTRRRRRASCSRARRRERCSSRDL